MSKIKLVLITAATWLVGCAYAAYDYVTTILALPDLGPGYERDWEFQLLMFAVFRLPFWVMGLLALVLAEVALWNPAAGKLR